MRALKNILLVVAISQASFASAANKEVVEGAMGFLLGGDRGWEFSTEHSSNGCVINYTQRLPSTNLKVQYDLNKAKWKSNTYKSQNGRIMFSVSGDSGIQILDGTHDNGEDAANYLLIKYGLAEGPGNIITFPLMTTLERAKAALADLMAECPGKTSRY